MLKTVLQIVQDWVSVVTARMKSVSVTTSPGVWGRTSPSVAAHRAHVLGAVQVASCQECPSASPSVAEQREQVLGAVQFASAHSCSHPHPESMKRKTVIKTNFTICFIRNTPFFAPLYTRSFGKVNKNTL